MMILNDEVVKLHKYLKIKKYKKILIITGKNSYFKSGANIILKSIIKDKNVKYYFKENFFPEIKELKKIIKLTNKVKPDLILAIGGGTVIDYSKVVSCTDYDQISFKKIFLGKVSHKKKFELCVIPTTAGSGAEVTSNSVIYINKKKFSFESLKLLPDHYILLPQLIFKLNQKIKASSGFDTIAQAIESILSLKSNKKSIDFAVRSLNLSMTNYLNFLKKPNSINTLKMCLAANLSGKAINISKTIAPHAVSYPFTSYFGISHGHAVSLTLNKFLLFNYNNMNYSKSGLNLRKRYKILFSATKTRSITQLDLLLKDIKKQANLEQNYKKLGIDIKKNFSKILNGTNDLRLRNNPVRVKKSDIYDIIMS
jgi:alcohol dehydrogenase class IV